MCFLFLIEFRILIFYFSFSCKWTECKWDGIILELLESIWLFDSLILKVAESNVRFHSTTKKVNVDTCGQLCVWNWQNLSMSPFVSQFIVKRWNKHDNHNIVMYRAIDTHLFPTGFVFFSDYFALTFRIKSTWQSCVRKTFNIYDDQLWIIDEKEKKKNRILASVLWALKTRRGIFYARNKLSIADRTTSQLIQCDKSTE